MEDLNHPKVLSDLLESARTKAGLNGPESQAQAIMDARSACDKRGYHRVSKEPQTEHDTIICYDCDLWFDKEFAGQYDIIYRVEPIL